MAPRYMVVADHLSKRFVRGERHDSLRDLVPAAIRRLRGQAAPVREANEFWALRDVNFAVAPGEALGVIGPNGAGKSTLLKTLTRILRPTDGRCAVRGRTGALIEIAAGFHPDLTGRENVYLQGAIMGMRRREIDAVLEEVVEFAGVAPFIDTPVKRYSSGMNARLGFSIAAHLRPDVLIIDEVLAVGDLAFQAKCVQRMKAFKRDGVAIVFVSHHMQAISDLCDRAVFLKSTVRAIGTPQEVIGRYLSEFGLETAGRSAGSVEIVGARLTTADGTAPEHALAPGARLRLEVDYVAHEPGDQYVFGFLLHRSTDGVCVYDGNVSAADAGVSQLRSGERITLTWDFAAHVTRGQYHLECHVRDDRTGEHVARLSPAATFAVEERRSWRGIADLELECAARSGESSVERIASSV